MKTWQFVLAWCAVSLVTAVAHAHKPSDSYLTITGGGETLAVRWDLALKDLELLVGLDTDQDGRITWGELKARRDAVVAHALSRLAITAEGADCELDLDELRFTQHSDGGYAVLELDTACPGDAETITIAYDLLFDLDPTHRGLVRYQVDDAVSTHILTPDARSIELRAGDTSLWRALFVYIREGVWHIWIGFDHVLFLLSLLLPAVWVWRENKWKPVETFRPAFNSVLKIVTVFTLAHSVTLWLAVMEYVTLPGRWVEVVIAASIIVTALNNLLPVLRLSGWMIAFAFGLVHGFGFANVLIDLGLTRGALAVSLLGFNVGVELGQIAIVLVFMPVAYALRGTGFYRWVVFTAGSVAIALIAMLWMVERAFNLELIGF